MSKDANACPGTANWHVQESAQVCEMGRGKESENNPNKQPMCIDVGSTPKNPVTALHGQLQGGPEGIGVGSHLSVCHGSRHFPRARQWNQPSDGSLKHGLVDSVLMKYTIKGKGVMMQYLPLHVRVHPCVVERDGCAICSDTPRITRPLSQRLHHTYSKMGSVRPSGHRTRRSSRSKEIKPYKDYLLPLGVSLTVSS